MFHICRRVVHPLEILLELIFIDLNPYCLTYITYRDSLLTDEGWMSKGRLSVLTVFVPILTVNLNTFSVTEHRLADMDTSSCGSFEVDSDLSDLEGKYVNFFQLNDTFTILHKGFIFIFGTLLEQPERRLETIFGFYQLWLVLTSSETGLETVPQIAWHISWNSSTQINLSTAMNSSPSYKRGLSWSSSDGCISWSSRLQVSPLLWILWGCTPQRPRWEVA